MRGLADRVAVVTGGASGIGRSVAERLSQEGAKVVVVDRHGDAAEEVVNGLPADGLAVQADVSQPEDVDGYMAAARERFGRVDLHHLNAGISGSFAPMAELTPEDFDAVIAVNLRGIFLGIRAALKDFTADHGRGRSSRPRRWPASRAAPPRAPTWPPSTASSDSPSRAR